MTARYVVRRLLQVIPSLAGIVLITFVLVHAAPGDPLTSIGADVVDPRQLAELRHQHGFDRPLPAQFVTYAGNLLQGDLGESYAFHEPVSSVIRRRVGPTLLLMGTALVFSSALGILLGTLAARRPSGRFDAGVSTATLFGYAIPGFWLGQIVLLIFAVHFGLFPVGGYTDLRIHYTGLAHVRDVLYHLILPASVLAVTEVALLTRVTRGNLVDQMDRDYIRTARAKGLGDWDALSRHAIPNALLPVVTILGTRVGFLFSGALIIENIFGWPGLGTVTRTAAEQNDRPLVLGMVLFVATAVVIANLVTDLVYAWIDPRVRHR